MVAIGNGCGTSVRWRRAFSLPDNYLKKGPVVKIIKRGKKSTNKNSKESIENIKQKEFLGEDYYSVVNGGKLDKFKPVFKMLSGITIFAIIVFGVNTIVTKPEDNHKSQNTSYITQDQQIDSEENTIETCLEKSSENNSFPDVSDPDFYQKAISYYDDNLKCYNEFPDPEYSAWASEVERLRKGAIDSSGGYKETYLSTKSYDYEFKTSSTSSFAPQEVNTRSNETSNIETKKPEVDKEWCNAKSQEVAELKSKVDSKRSAVTSAKAQKSRAEDDVRARNALRGGSAESIATALSKVQSQYDGQISGLSNELSILQSQYFAAENEAINKGCYR